MANSYEKLISVTYEGGYVLPSFTTGTRDFPYDLENAAIELTKLYYLQRKDNPSVDGITIPDVVTLDYNRTSSDLVGGIPASIYGTLSRWIDRCIM